MARGQKPKEYASEDEVLRQFRARGNGGARFDYKPLDVSLLGMAVAAVTAKDGQIAFSTTKAGERGVVTVWYKGYPEKSYCEDLDEMQDVLAWLLDVFLPRTEEFDTWRVYAEAFKRR